MALWCTLLLKLSVLLLSFENKSIYMPQRLKKKLRFLVSSFAFRMFAAFSSECYCYCFKLLIYHIFLYNEHNNNYKS